MNQLDWNSSFVEYIMGMKRVEKKVFGEIFIRKNLWRNFLAKFIYIFIKSNLI